MLPTVKHTSSLNCKVLWLKITRWSDQKVWKCRWATNHSMLHCVIFYLSKTIPKCRNCEKKKFLLSASIGIKRESSNQVLPVRCTWSSGRVSTSMNIFPVCTSGAFKCVNRILWRKDRKNQMLLPVNLARVILILQWKLRDYSHMGNIQGSGHPTKIRTWSDHVMLRETSENQKGLLSIYRLQLS